MGLCIDLVIEEMKALMEPDTIFSYMLSLLMMELEKIHVSLNGGHVIV